ncbi:leucine--tRNA ligase [Candidatus Daviesbacteria bacterium]|nr:leucine--tRNA ligase [Candidatus Daviesbacteria bacterium]
MRKYIPSDIEPKWQKKWQEDKLYAIDLDQAAKKYYLLVEFTYPSGDLHIGHWFAFAVPDVLGRMKRMQDYQVFFPNGFDAFGLPAENAAIARGVHPRDWTLSNIENMKQQFGLMGAIHDWENSVITCLPGYYKWNQWIFLKMLEKGIAYKGRALANWCPNCQTVLANENVEAGECWRCGTEVVQKEVEQWFLRITEYADRLLWSDNPTVDWPKPIREGQNNWIGRSEGVNLRFKVKDMDIHFEMFDSVPQTFMAQTFTVIAPEHPMVYELVKGTEHEKEVMGFVEKIKKKKMMNKFEIDRDIEGVFTGRYLEYTPTGKSIPIWVASFVIYEYGTGVVNSSAHDERDFAFAKKYDIPLHPVMFPKDPKEAEKVKNLEYCYHHAPDGILQEPEEFKGRRWEEVRHDIIDYIEKKRYGKRKIQYHLHDWSISRQRYWGAPIPIIYCDNCGTVPVPEEDLPVELPYKVDYTPKGKPPLATAEDWINVKCPNCGGEAKREAETMDTFVDSSWYFLRYLDNKNDTEIASSIRLKALMPVDIYFGGAEHTLGHTLYSRFFYKFLSDLGVLGNLGEEYAKKRVHHGVILGPDGSRMSKSRGNVVNPDEQIKEYGADAVRLYLCFIGPYDIVAPWNPGGLGGVYHFLQRVWLLQEKLGSQAEKLGFKDLNIMHKTIKKVTEDLENIKFNTAVAALMEWLNHLCRKEKVSKEEFRSFLLLLAPFAPHITEELWQILEAKYSIHQQSWPKFDNKHLQQDQVLVVIQVNGKVRDTLLIQNDILSNKEVVEKMAKKSEKIQKFLTGKTVKKTIYVPGKIINLVI